MTKIFLDTNVIIAASIQANSKEFGKPITHIHFQESSHLLSILRKEVSKKIGITSKTVEGETYNKIIRAVKSELDKQLDYQKQNIASLFEEFSKISNICLNRTRQILSFIIIENPDKSEIKKNLEKVDDMVSYLHRLSARYATSTNRMIQAKRRKETTSKSFWKAELHREVYKAFREEVERESIQILKFMEKEPNGNNNDKQILAEAVTIKNQLDNTNQFYIASNDTKFFSPLRLKGGRKSNLVTSEINNRFGITCDTPLEIRKIIQKS